MKKLISKQINDNPEDFSKLVKNLPSIYYVGTQYDEEDPTEIQIGDGISDEFVESIKNNLVKKEYHFYIAKKYSKNEYLLNTKNLKNELIRDQVLNEKTKLSDDLKYSFLISNQLYDM